MAFDIDLIFYFISVSVVKGASWCKNKHFLVTWLAFRGRIKLVSEVSEKLTGTPPKHAFIK